MKKRGKGMACTFYGTGYGNGFPDVSRAWAALKEDGRISISTGATEVGQGAKTVLSQIAAETMGINIEYIDFICEDTLRTPDSGTAAASRQTYNTGNAVKRACEGLLDAMKKEAMKMLNLNTREKFAVRNDIIYLKTFPDKCVTFSDIAKFSGGIRQEGIFTAQTVSMDENGQGAPYWPYTFNACSVEVEVDTETGKIDVLRAVVAQDTGRAMNPTLVEGQIDGGFAMGMGFALYEDISLSNGKIENNSYSKYIIPTSMDVPKLERIIVEYPDETGPYGAKGIGEPVMLPAAPAILNAIYDAIGVRFYEIPVTQEKVIAALSKHDV